MIHMRLKGRLGNTCYQCATAIALSLDNNLPFTISNTTKDPVMQPLYFQHLVNPGWNPDIPARWMREMQHNYVPIVIPDDYRNYNIMFDGFYQSFKYFEHRRAQVIETLQIPIFNERPVGIHVRRGDYLTIPGKHILNDGEYMDKAIEYLNQRGFWGFTVFSDDIPWCKEYFKKYKNCDFRFSEGRDPLTDMGLLSSCWHFINSSSTFSLFASWLGRAKDKICISPKEWFQSTQPENCEDIVPPNYIRL
jgi:hypothetical protein